MNITRIDNSRRIHSVIEKDQLYTLDVAIKCLCQDQDAWNVIAKKVESSDEYEKHDDYLQLSLKEVQYLLSFAFKTGYKDWHSGNFIRDDKGKIIIIDTETDSFYMRKYRDPFEMFLCYDLRQAIKLDQDAQDWVREHREALIDRLYDRLKQAYYSKVISVYDNPKYDDSEIDFNKV